MLWIVFCQIIFALKRERRDPIKTHFSLFYLIVFFKSDTWAHLIMYMGRNFEILVIIVKVFELFFFHLEMVYPVLFK